MSWLASSLGATPLRDRMPTGSALPGTGTLSRRSQRRSRSSWTGCCGVIHTASETQGQRAGDGDRLGFRPARRQRDAVRREEPLDVVPRRGARARDDQRVVEQVERGQTGLSPAIASGCCGRVTTARDSA